ncbi:MAG: PIN domain nuclease [Candidatus Rokuibacteriota bacterium]|nr:MAG: PIN domain nuclease [Candidatus Rokubacteria bacterium]
MTVVVDASVAVKWVIPEVLSDRADALRDRANRLLAPDLLLVEAGNALWKKVTRREISTREARQALDLLMTSALDLRPSGPLLARALGLAVRLRHPVYDCVYLALAHAEGAALVTADRRLLARAARRRPRTPVIDLATL